MTTTMTKKDYLLEQLRKWLLSGRYTPGSRFPTENELMSEFQVSRIIVRQAVGELEKNGLLIRRQGAGTFVADAAENNGGEHVAVLIQYVEGTYTNILSGVEEEAALQNRVVVVCNHKDSLDVALDCLKRLALRKIMNLIFVPIEVENYEMANRKILEEARGLGINVVLADKIVNGGIYANFVGANGNDGIRSAVNHLIQLGHTRIGGIFNRPGFGAEVRYQGFLNELNNHGLAVNPEWVRRDFEEVALDLEGVAAARHILALPPSERPTAVVCVHDWVARNFCSTAREYGVRVPEDISITGFDDLSFAGTMTPRLTTVRQPLVEIGREAMRLLEATMTGRNETGRVTHCFVPTELIVRDSTCPVTNPQ